MKTVSGNFSWTPNSKLGQRSVWLEVAFVLMFAANIFINLYLIRPSDRPQMLIAWYAAFVIAMLICGLAGGVLGIFAVTKQHERSPLVWAAILCGLFVLMLILNELMQGIQYMLSA